MRIGIDLGGSHISIGLVNEKGEILLKKQKDITTEKKVEKFIEESVVGSIDEILQEKNLKSADIEQIGVASPGNFKKGNLTHLVNLGIEVLPITQIIQEHFSISVVGDNDVNCACLAEKLYGSLKEYQNSVFMTIGTGIGGAYIYQNKVVNPEENSGFEFGHMIIEKEGKDCKCGKKGCFEVYCSIKNLRRKMRSILQLEDTVRGKEIVAIMKQNRENTQMQEELTKYCSYLAVGLSNIVNILEPEVIGIGGSFVHFAPFLVEKTMQEIQQKQLLFNPRQKPFIKLATLKNDAGIIGSAML